MVSWSVIAGETPTATKWNILGTNDAEFDSRISQLITDNTIGAATDSSTVSLDMSVRRHWEVTISGNRTIVFANVNTKRTFSVIIKQDGTGGRTVTWPSGISWPFGTVPPVSTIPNVADIFVFIPKSTWVAGSNEVYWGLTGANSMS